ncbi:glycoside hydrolase family 3 C-terminal domain-containing protein [Novosphingobium colocasiae]
MGGEAIAAVLFGEANPSGRLPITFPASEAQLPRPHLDGSDWVESAGLGEAKVPERQLSADYDIEGSDVGYRWFSRTGARPLFPFGYGLSYTSFEARNLKNLGVQRQRHHPQHRCSGWRRGRATLSPGSRWCPQAPSGRVFRGSALSRVSKKRISIRIDPRLLADWNGSGWQMPAGAYEFAIGKDAETMVTRASISIAGADLEWPGTINLSPPHAEKNVSHSDRRSVC